MTTKGKPELGVELPANDLSVERELVVVTAVPSTADAPPLALEEQLNASKVNVVARGRGGCSPVERHKADGSFDRLHGWRIAACKLAIHFMPPSNTSSYIELVMATSYRLKVDTQSADNNPRCQHARALVDRFRVGTGKHLNRMHGMQQHLS